jgi:hypothetical protein
VHAFSGWTEFTVSTSKRVNTREENHLVTRMLKRASSNPAGEPMASSSANTRRTTGTVHMGCFRIARWINFGITFSGYCRGPYLQRLGIIYDGNDESSGHPRGMSLVTRMVELQVNMRGIQCHSSSAKSRPKTRTVHVVPTAHNHRKIV